MNLPGKITAQGSAVAQQPTRRELMDRMGHSSTRAAYIYQHRTALRDKMIADEISRRVEAEQTRSGTQRARGDKEPS